MAAPLAFWRNQFVATLRTAGYQGHLSHQLLRLVQRPTRQYTLWDSSDFRCTSRVMRDGYRVPTGGHGGP